MIASPAYAAAIAAKMLTHRIRAWTAAEWMNLMARIHWYARLRIGDLVAHREDSDWDHPDGLIIGIDDDGRYEIEWSDSTIYSYDRCDIVHSLDSDAMREHGWYWFAVVLALIAFYCGTLYALAHPPNFG